MTSTSKPARRKTAPGAQAPRRRGRPNPESALAKEQVVATALRLIDEDGLEQFSLRKLAGALGVYPAAIYWHVVDRNALLAEVVSHALQDAVLPAPGADWKHWLRELLQRFRQLVHRHPNIAPLIGTQLLSNSGAAPAMIEGILQALHTAGFEDELLIDAYNAVLAAQVGFVTQELAQAPAEDADNWRAGFQRRLRDIDPLAYPLLASTLPAMENKAFCLRWSNGTEVPLDSGFQLFIEALIVGLEQRALHEAGNVRRR
jgi:TetR/AcrR family transcriptional regulator, tetracycline repressor protein